MCPIPGDSVAWRPILKQLFAELNPDFLSKTDKMLKEHRGREQDFMMEFGLEYAGQRKQLPCEVCMRYAHHADCSNKPSIAKQEPDGLAKRNGRWRKRKAKWIKAREERKRYSDADTSDANGGDGDVSYASGYEESSDGDATDSASQSSEPAAGSRKQVNAAGDVEAVAPVGDASTVAPADDGGAAAPVARAGDGAAGAPSEWKPTL